MLIVKIPYFTQNQLDNFNIEAHSISQKSVYISNC